MRAEWATLPFDADTFEAIRNQRLNTNHLICARFHAYPQRPGSPARRKGADGTQLEAKWRMWNRGAHALDDRRGMLLRDFTDKDERDVQLIALRPTDRRRAHRFVEAGLLVHNATLRCRSDFDGRKEPRHPARASSAAYSWRPAPIETSPCRAQRETGMSES